MVASNARQNRVPRVSTSPHVAHLTMALSVTCQSHVPRSQGGNGISSRQDMASNLREAG